MFFATLGQALQYAQPVRILGGQMQIKEADVELSDGEGDAGFGHHGVVHRVGVAPWPHVGRDGVLSEGVRDFRECMQSRLFRF